MDIAATGLVEVVASRRRDIRDRTRHRDADPQDVGCGVSRAATETDEDTGGSGAHQVQCCLIGRAAPDNDGDLQLVDEGLEVEGRMPRRHVLGRHRRAPDHQEIDPRGHRHGSQAARRLGRDPRDHGHAGIADLPKALGDESLIDIRGGIDLLEQRRRLVGGRLPNLLELWRRIGVTSPQALEVEGRRDPEATELDRARGRDDRVHRSRHHGCIEAIGVDLPRGGHLVCVAGTPTRGDGDLVKGVGHPAALASADLDVCHVSPNASGSWGPRRSSRRRAGGSP